MDHTEAYLMVNGEYGNLDWYKERMKDKRYLLCTDGAGSIARKISTIPDAIVGDMDSISVDDLGFMCKAGVEIYRYPPEKDYTDMHLSLEYLMDKGFGKVTVFGGTGGRLDHTLGNILTGVYFTKKGMDISYYEPGLTVYLTRSGIDISGKPGDRVSVFSMAGLAEGVDLQGFKYPLKNATLAQEYPIGISNELSGSRGKITADSGILAIFHYDNI